VMMNRKAIFYLLLIFLITVFSASPSVASQPSLTEAMVKNVILSWYQGTNDHKPLADQLALLTDDVEMRYPDTSVPFTGKKAFSKWYEDVLVKYFDEIHKVESWDIKISGQLAIVDLVVRWERRRWNPGEATSHYEASVSRQYLELVRLPADGRVLIRKKIVKTFEKTAPIYNVES